MRFSHSGLAIHLSSEVIVVTIIFVISVIVVTALTVVIFIFIGMIVTIENSDSCEYVWSSVNTIWVLSLPGRCGEGVQVLTTGNIFHCFYTTP